MKKILQIFLGVFFLLGTIQMKAQERIKMIKDPGGTYTIPCEVNGLKLSFIFDTGASDVSLSALEATFMLKNGYIDKSDFIGSQSYSIANGELEENAIINLKTIKIGNKILNNVRACISSHINAPLLLGQSALRKLGNYSIEGDYLVLESQGFNSASDNDSEKSRINELKNKADSGDPDAQKYLGNLYYLGDGVEQNFYRAVYYYRKAAENGNTDAMCSLASCYELGNGVQQNDMAAFNWYFKAANLGDASAQCSIGLHYELGIVVSKNISEAIKWYRLAAKQEHEYSKQRLDILGVSY